MDEELNKKSLYLDKLLSKGSPYAKPLTSGFSIFPLDSPLYSVVNTGKEKKHEKFQVASTLKKISDEIRELEIDLPVKIEFLKTKFGQADDFKILESQIHHLQEAFNKFSEFSKQKLDFSGDAAALDGMIPDISQTRDLGPASLKLQTILNDYHEFLDASQLISDLLEDFNKTYECHSNCPTKPRGTSLRDSITKEVSYLDMLLSRLTSLDRYQS